MRIAFVYDVIYPYVKGGVEKRIWELAKRLSAKGHEIHIYGMKYWEGPATIRKEDIFLHGVCPPYRLYKPEGRRSIRQVLYYTLLLPLSLFKERYDVVDCQSSPYMPAYICWLYGKIRGVPITITWHEVWTGYWREYMGILGIFGNVLERGCMRLTHHNIPVSENTKKKLEQKKVRCEPVIPNGVDIERIKEIKPSDDKSDIIFVGRLIKTKNVDLIIAATEKIKKKYPNAKVVIVGDGPEKIKLQNQARARGLSGNIIFTGFIERHDDIFAHMKASRVFAFPSTREGFAIAVVEAAASGLPIVTVKHEDNAAADLLSDGISGLKVELNSEELAEAFDRLLGDEEYRKTMGKAAKEMSSGHDWNASSERLITILKKITGK